eukprot:6525037-Alexandrium_andersonii.AAC.1
MLLMPGPARRRQCEQLARKWGMATEPTACATPGAGGGGATSNKAVWPRGRSQAIWPGRATRSPILAASLRRALCAMLVSHSP